MLIDWQIIMFTLLLTESWLDHVVCIGLFGDIDNKFIDSEFYVAT